jgi:hypothetical protein
VTGIPGAAERLRAAAAAVEEAGLPADLRSAGLVLAFWAEGGTAGATERQLGGAGALGDVAIQLGVEPDDLERIFDFDDGDIALIIPRRALSTSKGTAMAEVTHLVVAARQSLGLGDWTPADAVREACEDRGVLDGNFGRVIQSLNGEGFRVRGTGAKRELKMNASGVEATIALINNLSAGLS